MNKGEDSLNLLQKKIEELRNKPQSIRAAVRAEEFFSLLVEQIDAVNRNAIYVEQLELLREIAKNLVEVHNLEQLAKHILEGANKLIAFSDGAIGLVDEGIIRFPYAIGKSATSVKEFKIPIGEGITGWVVKNKVPQKIDDASKDHRYRDQITTTKSELDVPIIYAGKGIGVINIESENKNAFTDDDVRLLTTLAEHASIAIKNAQLFNKVEARTKIIERITSTLEYTNVLELILETIFDIIKCTEASVGVIDNETKEIRFNIAKGIFKKEVEKYVMSIDKGLNGWVVRNKKSVRVGDVTLDPRYESQITTTRSELDVPMIFEGKVIGVLNVESPNLNAFSEEDEEFLKGLAPYAVVALRNAQIYEDVKKHLEVERERHIAAETMAAIGDLAGSLVHRMNNNVGAIRVRAGQIKKLTNDKSLLTKAIAIENLSEKVLGEVKDFREKFKDVEPSELDINKIIIESINEVPITEKITVTKKLDGNLKYFFAAEVHLKEVIRNLIANAVESMHSGGHLLIESKQLDEKIVIAVSDTGSGISNEDQKKVFNRGFSTKEEGKGLGFGLWWVKNYLNRNGCDIEISKPETGMSTTFRVILK